MHLDWDGGTVGKPNEEYTEYLRHIKALKQLLPRIPPDKANLAAIAVDKLLDHCAQAGAHQRLWWDAVRKRLTQS
jgi:hypothetical protein